MKRIGGRPVELTTAPFPSRRAVYGFIDRQDLPNLFRVFDIASPDQSSPRRPRTTVPQQALFLMNSPFVVEQAKASPPGCRKAKRSTMASASASSIKSIFQRRPSSSEEAIGQAVHCRCPRR